MAVEPTEVRVAKLEVKMDNLERETTKQTTILNDQNVRLTRIERLIYICIGVIITIEFGLKVTGILR